MKEENEIENEVIDPEVMQDEAVEVYKRPSVPVTIDELAALAGEGGLEIAKARAAIIDNLRRASISLTSPQDWLLFKNDAGATGYCQDTGCKRYWQLWGIEISPRGDFEKITDDETKDFAYRCYGDGFCQVTGLFLKNVEGVRYSTEDFCKDLPQLKKEVRVRQAAVANRDGSIIRALAGMKSIPIEMLEEVWKGTGKSTDHCNLGKGYGSKAERMGAAVQQSDINPDEEPMCTTHGLKMKFLPAGTSKAGKPYSAFWACPNRECKYTLRHSDVLEQVKMDRRDAAEQREPGQEG